VGVRQVAFGDVLVTRMNAERQGETTIPNRGFTPTDSAYHPTPTNRVTPAPMDQHTTREPRGQRKPDHHNRSLNRAAAGARQAASTRAHATSQGRRPGCKFSGENATSAGPKHHADGKNKAHTTADRGARYGALHRAPPSQRPAHTCAVTSTKRRAG